MTPNQLRIGDWLMMARRYLADLEARRLSASHFVSGDPDAPHPADPNTARYAQVLMGHVLSKPRAWVLAHPETLLDEAQQNRLDNLLARLGAGEPLPYLIGHWEFFGLDFEVNSAVLIPRPETELLVETSLDWLKHHPGRRRAADVGTGTGCIAVSLAAHCSEITLLAVDISGAALSVARRNVLRHQVNQQVRLVRGSLLSAFDGQLDLVCANLPYIPAPILASLDVAKYEPGLALNGGPDGLVYITALLADAPRWLAPGGLLLLEMQNDQGDAVIRLANQYLPNARVEILSDLAGWPRIAAVANMATR